MTTWRQSRLTFAILYLVLLPLVAAGLRSVPRASDRPVEGMPPETQAWGLTISFGDAVRTRVFWVAAIAGTPAADCDRQSTAIEHGGRAETQARQHG